MMEKMPKWILDLKAEDGAATGTEDIPSGYLAYEALEIAWEALEQIEMVDECAYYEIARHALNRIRVLGGKADE